MFVTYVKQKIRSETINATGIWVVPPGVTQIMAVGCGGGTGGRGGSLSSAIDHRVLGGRGALVIAKFLTVVPGTTLNVTIGAGSAGTAGTNSSSSSANPGNGGDSSIDDGVDTLATFPGAQYASGGGYDQAFATNGYGTRGVDGAASASGPESAGGGGAPSIGNGGNGGTAAQTNNTNGGNGVAAAANSGAGGGAGGKGDGASGGAFSGGTGGTGGSGRVTIYWSSVRL